MEERDRTIDTLMQMIDMDRKDRRSTKKIAIICCTICVVCVLVLAGIFVAFANGMEITTTTEETTVSQDTENGTGNNVYQAGEYADYVEGSD